MAQASRYRHLKSPLLLFLLIGAMLFALDYGRERLVEGEDSRHIRVDDRTLGWFVQHRARLSDSRAATAWLERAPDTEVDRLVADYVREEALYREALALGLGESDYVIRQRLVQKMTFIIEGAAAVASPSPDAVARHYQAHRTDYAEPATLTFTHVYFNPQRHGPDKAESHARAALAELNRASTSFADASQHGDRFLYRVNYVEQDVAVVESHFGAAFARELLARPADRQRWQGPLRSDHGHHLVLMTGKREARTPELAEVLPMVTADARRRRIQTQTESAVAEILARYAVTVDLTRPGADRAGRPAPVRHAPGRQRAGLQKPQSRPHSDSSPSPPGGN